MIKKIIGYAILALVFGGMIVAMALDVGWIGALIILLIATMASALILLGLMLILEDNT